MELKELGQLLKEHSESNKGFQIHLNSGNIDTLCGKSIDVEFSDLYFTNCKMLRDKHTLVFCNDDKQPVGFDDEINQPLYPMEMNSNMFINVMKITAIEDVVNKEDWFTLPSSRVVNLYMSYGNIVTIGFIE